MELKLYTAPLTEIRGWSNIKPVMLFTLEDGKVKCPYWPDCKLPGSWIFNPPDNVFVTYYHTEDKA